MSELNIGGSGKWIPSGVGRSDGWILVRKIDVGGGQFGLVYVIEDDSWLPKQMDVATDKTINDKNARTPARTDWDEQPLGQVTDKELADKLGVGVSTVAKARSRRGIKAINPVKDVDWSKEQLGKLPDGVIARDLDVPQHCVTRARSALGIPAFKRTKATTAQ